MVATRRVTASGAALNGSRTTTPERSTTSAIGSATTRTGTNAGDGDGADGPGSAARIRRQRSKFDRVSRRARQNALAVCPDRFQASIVARQARAFSGRCLDMTEFSQWGKLTEYPTTQGVTSPDTYPIQEAPAPSGHVRMLTLPSQPFGQI